MKNDIKPPQQSCSIQSGQVDEAQNCNVIKTKKMQKIEPIQLSYIQTSELKPVYLFSIKWYNKMFDITRQSDI